MLQGKQDSVDPFQKDLLEVAGFFRQEKICLESTIATLLNLSLRGQARIN